ncbi:MAG: hypothetical protein IJU81_03405 [Bacteroidales bacterium]|nr:hypothetical protein [Bacteroidales bacterium]
MKKKILSFIVVVIAGMAAIAQSVNVELNPDIKKTKDDSPQFIGCDNQRVVFLENSVSGDPTISLVSYSLDLQELARVELTKTNGVNSYGGFVNGQHIDLLFAEFQEDQTVGKPF